MLLAEVEKSVKPKGGCRACLTLKPWMGESEPPSFHYLERPSTGTHNVPPVEFNVCPSQM